MIIEIKITNEDEQESHALVGFRGDELTSPVSEAIEYLQELQQQEMVV